MEDKWIVFDVDDVLCNFRESLYQSFRKIGKDIHWSQWEVYHHSKIYNLPDTLSLHNHMKDSLVLENAEVEQEALEVLTQLKKEGYKIGLLTARAWHAEGQNITEEFIFKNNLPVDKLVISGQHQDKKSMHIDKFEGKIIAFLDDSIHHVKDFQEHGIPAWLQSRPWNESDKALPRVASLKEFYQQIKILENQDKNDSSINSHNKLKIKQ
jgi:uncharacterized HAD superfamily protein